MSTATQVGNLLNDPNAAVTPPSSDAGASQTPATPDASQQATPATPANPWSAPLKVNDRTSYASPEDAIKGFTELQTTVTRLSDWEKLISAPVEKGGFGLTDPKQVAALLDELADIRAKNQSSQQATPAANDSNRSDATTVQAAAAGDKVAYDSLSPEWKAHVDYLNKLGYVTKDALKPLEDQLSAINRQSEEAYAQQVENAVAHGTTLLEGSLKAAGVTVTPEQLEKIGNVVGSAIDRGSYDARGKVIPDSLADKFLKGNEAARKAIIDEQVKLFLDFGESFATAKTAKYVAEKNAAQSSQPRTLPPGSSPASTNRPARLNEDQRKKAVADVLASGGMS